MTIDDTVENKPIPLLEAIKEVERKTTALSFDPENLYKAFQVHEAYREQDTYRGISSYGGN